MISDITAIGYWTCWKCNCENSIFLIKDKKVDDVLECSFCDYVSSELNWEKS